MSRPLRIPHPEGPLRLYRHLLREASYLPAIARPFADRQIKDRFRQHKKDDEDDKCKQRIREAHRQLRVLRAANAGDLLRMRKLLLRVFGRLGRRRRELMADLLRREVPVPQNTAELEKVAADTAAVAASGRPRDWLDSWDLDKLRTFARSQAQASLPNSPKADITHHQATPENALPTENAWGQPLHPRLARTKLKKLWKSVADKCMPPLPK